MTKIFPSILLTSILTSAAFLPNKALAVDGLSANIGATSNYLWRGVSQTQDAAAISGGIDYSTNSGFYIGAWTSNIDFNDNASYELDLYLGFSDQLSQDLSYDIGYIYYGYPDSAEVDANNQYDFGEIYGSLSYQAFSIGAYYGVNNDKGAQFADRSLYLSADAEFEVAKDLTLALHIGRYTFDDNNGEDYSDYSVSLSKSGFSLVLSDTNLAQDDLKLTVSYTLDIDL